MFLGDWSAKGQELQLSEHCRFHFMPLKLISKDNMNILLSFSSAVNRLIMTRGFIIVIDQNPCIMKSLIMKVCAKDRIEDIKIISKQEKRRKINTYVLIISRLLRYGCPKCWCQVLHPTHKQNNFVHPTVPNHM